VLKNSQARTNVLITQSNIALLKRISYYTQCSFAIGEIISPGLLSFLAQDIRLKSPNYQPSAVIIFALIRAIQWQWINSLPSVGHSKKSSNTRQENDVYRTNFCFYKAFNTVPVLKRTIHNNFLYIPRQRNTGNCPKSLSDNSSNRSLFPRVLD